MLRTKSIWVGIPLILAACATTNNTTKDGFIAVLPEALLTIVAPGQDLTAVRINPTDGCYVYRHAGPVETTFLPLRAKRGGPICTQAVDAKTAG